MNLYQVQICHYKYWEGKEKTHLDTCDVMAISKERALEVVSEKFSTTRESLLICNLAEGNLVIPHPQRIISKSDVDFFIEFADGDVKCFLTAFDSELGNFYWEPTDTLITNPTLSPDLKTFVSPSYYGFIKDKSWYGDCTAWIKSFNEGLIVLTNINEFSEDLGAIGEKFSMGFHYDYPRYFGESPTEISYGSRFGQFILRNGTNE
jgi:hypothetical protein